MTFLRQGASNGRSTPTVHLRPPHVSETIRARKLKFYTQLGSVKYSFRVWIFSTRQRARDAGVLHPLHAPSGKNSYPKRVYDLPNCMSNFNFLRGLNTLWYTHSNWLLTSHLTSCTEYLIHRMFNTNRCLFAFTSVACSTSNFKEKVASSADFNTIYW